VVSIVFIERAGRKVLLMAGIWGMALFALALAISRILVVRNFSLCYFESHVFLNRKNEVSWFRYISAVSVVLYMVFFSIGPGPIPWIITSELFNSDARGKASSVAVFVNFLSNFIVTFIFPYLEVN
jgi:MFS family permease